MQFVNSSLPIFTDGSPLIRGVTLIWLKRGRKSPLGEEPAGGLGGRGDRRPPRVCDV
jgi:hypothetical protein